ncbi:MAG: hypothetical protein LBG95_09065 [Treponema sp.]|jgi:hypothetical protein|nr:hypothetical protein [Treponema sp.]
MAKTTKKPQASTKPGAKKTTPKAKAPAKKATAKTTARTKPETVQAKTTPIKTSSVKRPPQTPGIPENVINDVIAQLAAVKTDLESYAAHLRALDRKRLQSIGTRKEGFAQRAYRLAMDNPEFLPNYLAQDRYTEDYDHFMILQTAVDLESQVRELLKNINIECMDYFYTDGLDFYAAVREAAKRRVDAAEAIHTELYDTYFKKMGKKGETEPTEKQQLRDAKGIIRGTREGKFEAVNIKPKATGGVHKVIDEQFKDTAKFKETEEGEIDE